VSCCHYIAVILAIETRCTGKEAYHLFQGALIGGITSAVGSCWLTIGSFTMTKIPHPILPSLSIDGCTQPNNLTFHNYDVTNSSSAYRFSDESPVNATMTYFRPPLTSQTIEVTF